MYKMKNQEIEMIGSVSGNDFIYDVILNGKTISANNSTIADKAVSYIKEDLKREMIKIVKAAVAIANIDIDFESDYLKEIIKVLK